MISGSSGSSGPDSLTLVAGVTGVVIIILFVISNFFLGGVDAPSAGADADEIAEFIADRGDSLEWDAGMRYIVFFLVPFFIFGVARQVRRSDELASSLATVALLCTIWIVATGTVANTFESILIFERERLMSEPELTRAFHLGMTAMFNAASLPHALVIGCLSAAGWRTKTLPRWLCVLGVVPVIAGLVGVPALARSLEEDTVAEGAIALSFISFGVWYLLASAALIGAWMRQETDDSPASTSGS